MTITRTEIFKLTISMEPFVIATETCYYTQNVFIRVHTDSGLVGMGECSAFPLLVGETQNTCYEVAQDFAKLLTWGNANQKGLTGDITFKDRITAQATGTGAKVFANVQVGTFSSCVLATNGTINVASPRMFGKETTPSFAASLGPTAVAFWR